MTGDFYLVKRTDGTVETRYRELPIDDRIDNAWSEWQSLPWHKRLFWWLVSW